MEKSSSFLQKHIYLLAALLFGSFFVFGTFFPETWWSTHWLAYGNPVIRFLWLGLGLLLLAWPFIAKNTNNSPSWLDKQIGSQGYIWGLALLAGLLMYLFAMPFDFYGDAIEISEALDKTVESLPKGTNEHFFNLSLSPWAGHQKVLSLATYIAYFIGGTYREAFVLLDSACGVLFTAVWLHFLHQVFKRNSWRILMGMAGIFAPFMLAYFGHCESYAVVYLLFLLLATQLYFFIVKPSTSRLTYLVLSLIVCLLFHSVALLFIPGILLVVIRHFFGGSTLSHFLKSWKGISLGMILPIFLMGLVLYFFVFEDYKDQRSFMETAKEFDRLFLPLLTPPTPLDSYNLLSLNHITDFFFEILLWSPLALMLLVISLLVSPKIISWNSLPIQVFGINLLLFTAFFFMLNPLLSMPMDWDLMAIPAIPLLIFTAILIKDIQQHLSTKTLLPMALGISLLSLPVFTIHHQEDLHAQRLETVGKRVYSTYYEWTHRVIEASLNKKTFESRQAYDEYKLALLKKLEKGATPGIDYEISRMYMQEGRYYLREAKQPDKAMSWLEKAYHFYPKGQNEILYLLEANFLLEDYETAHKLSLELIDIQYPSAERSQAIALECAIRAGKIQQALSHAQQYNALNSENATILEVERRIKAGETEGLIELYSR